MKKYLIILVVTLSFGSFAWGEPPVRQVEVVNWPDTQDVNIVQSPPVQYEYYVFEGEGEQMLNINNLLSPGQYMDDIRNLLNDKSAEGFELNFFTVTRGHGPPHHYVIIMRRPVP